jgi:hypothetical protein
MTAGKLGMPSPHCQADAAVKLAAKCRLISRRVRACREKTHQRCLRRCAFRRRPIVHERRFMILTSYFDESGTILVLKSQPCPASWETSLARLPREAHKWRSICRVK